MVALLFDADRASLLTRLVLDVVETFAVDLSRLHNDSTSSKLSGAYGTAGWQERGAKRTLLPDLGSARTIGPTQSSSYGC